MAVEVTAANYADTIEKSEKLVLLDVWAPWCVPCRMMEPALNELAATFADKITLAKLNTDEEPDLAGRLGVSGLPTLRLIKNGQIVNEWLGVTDKNRIAQAIEAAK